MKRAFLGFSLLMVLSCQSPGERTALPPPLPEKVVSLPYAELLTRARAQASLANDAFYVDHWPELEEAARGLEQTSQYLVKADDVPVKHRDTLTSSAADLGKQATLLREAAVARDVKKATTLLAQINLMVRELRLSN